MTDYHVIGQFDKAYYFADRVFSALKASGVDEVYFSSTTSCLYCPPKDLYEGVRGEVKDALSAAAEIGIKAYPASLVQLAHSRPLFDTLHMLQTYPNTACDSAMVSKESIERIQNAGFADRIRYGTDFPITHYRAIHPKEAPTQEELKAFLLR